MSRIPLDPTETKGKPLSTSTTHNTVHPDNVSKDQRQEQPVQDPAEADEYQPEGELQEPQDEWQEQGNP